MISQVPGKSVLKAPDKCTAVSWSGGGHAVCGSSGGGDDPVHALVVFLSVCARSC